MHLWVRAEERDNERRVGVMPAGVEALRRAGMTVTVEESAARAIPTDRYAEAGAAIAPSGSWRAAPDDAVVFGLKELPEDGSPLVHRHIMFGHAYKGQPAGQVLLSRFGTGGGVLLDLEYLLDESGRRLAAFGYWAGFAGAAVTFKCWAAQARDGICGPITVWDNREALVGECRADLDEIATDAGPPSALIIGAKGRVGTGAADFCHLIGLDTTLWDLEETRHGGPFPEVFEHALFFNCILAQPGAPVFVPADAVAASDALRVIGDIACDPTSDFSPVKVYDRVTTWQAPALRVRERPALDVMAIDNLPSLLPAESSEDFASQLLPVLLDLPAYDRGDAGGSWSRAEALYRQHAPVL